MVVVSQIWVQCTRCTSIIGHVHLRVGSELEPELGGSLYTALVLALSQMEQSGLTCQQYAVSGVYGYRIPDNEGVGLFTVQSKNFRIFFLCEGLYGRGIPYLAGMKIGKKLRKLFSRLAEIIDQEHCDLLHPFDELGSFWFDLIFSSGFGENIPLEEIEKVLPLQFIRIQAKRKKDNRVDIESIESAELESLGYGWQSIDDLLNSKIQAIFGKPEYSFLIFEALFHQISEFVTDLQFIPNTIILSYQTGDLQENVSLVAFLSLHNEEDRDGIEELRIRYCLPVLGVELEGVKTVHSYLRSLFLDPL
ncbi:MAG: hypothetical protein ACW964_11795 [Candidatus Hodarchaeales archaeon]